MANKQLAHLCRITELIRFASTEPLRQDSPRPSSHLFKDLEPTCHNRESKEFELPNLQGSLSEIVLTHLELFHTLYE